MSIRNGCLKQASTNFPKIHKRPQNSIPEG